MPRLLYDLSLLGIAHRNRATFGLSRTTECLLDALLERPELTIGACSDLSFNVWLNSRIYWGRKGYGARLPWPKDAMRVRMWEATDETLVGEAEIKRQLRQLQTQGRLEGCIAASGVP
jgi:hypothetical protein